MQHDGQQADEHHDATRQVERLDHAADAGLAQDVAQAEAVGLQPGLERGDGTAQHQGQGQQAIGQPGQPGRDRAGGDAVELHLDIAHPFGRPFLGVGKVPAFPGHQETRARGQGRDGQAHQATNHRREFRAQVESRQGVGHGEGESREQCKWNGRQRLGPGAVATEEAGHEHDQEHRNQGARDRMAQCHPFHHQVEEVTPGLALGLQQLGHGFTLQATLHTHQQRGADGAKRHRGGLDDHAEQHRRQGREAHRHHQRAGHGGRGAEAGGAFDEAAEQPRDQDRLDAAVRRNAGEAAADAGNAAGMLERVEQQQRAKDDPQHLHRDDEALDRGCGDAVEADAPGQQGDQGSDQIDQRHGLLG